jgi:hypothetical protein
LFIIYKLADLEKDLDVVVANTGERLSTDVVESTVNQSTSGRKSAARP